jgi:hypothetical protein
MLLVVVEMMFLLGILGFIIFLGNYGFVGGTYSVDHSKFYKLIFLSNQSNKKGLESWFFISFP